MEGTQGDYKGIKRWRTLPDRMYNTIRRVGCPHPAAEEHNSFVTSPKIIRIKISYASWTTPILNF